MYKYEECCIELYKANGFSYEEALNEIDFIREVMFGYTYKDAIAGKTLDENQIAKMREIVKNRVETRRPVQQLTGCAFFFGRLFRVSEHTLIPRPETELAVVALSDKVKQINSKNIKCLDIGTGTGCIAITSLIENGNLNFDAVDISAEALEVARENAQLHKVAEKINFLQSDLFGNVGNKYDIIVSNPPYIPFSDRNTLQIEVREFDPALALFAYDEKGIEVYEKIIEQSGDYLNPGGYIIFELGINQSPFVKELFIKNGFSSIETTKDLDGIERVITAKLC